MFQVKMKGEMDGITSTPLDLDYGRVNAIIDSRPLYGESIFQQLGISSLGQFQNLLHDLIDDNEFEKFQLPRVVVIGAESSGKSSLLEKITKCQLFPRHADICTKMPIKLELIHVKHDADASMSVTYTDMSGTLIHATVTDPDSILPNLQRFMDMRGNQITDDEFIITIKSQYVKTFTVIDLPGIRAYPEDMAIMTHKIVNKYMDDPHTLIMCVVPATVPRLTSLEAIALIEKYKKQAQSILVLTMPDRVIERDFDELVAQRVAGLSNELEGMNIKVCVAVKNRTHHNDVSLVVADDDEKVFFAQALGRISDSELKMKAEINCGLGNLLRVMDDVYRDYIMDVWKPLALSMLQDHLSRLDGEIACLGSTTLTMGPIIQDFMTRIPDYDFDFASTSRLQTVRKLDECASCQNLRVC